MSATILIAIFVLVLAAGLFVSGLIPAVRTFFRYRGKRLITCPETHKAAAVDVDVKQAAVGAFLKEPTRRLSDCSRWPERQDCGQDCLQQVEADPENCLVWNVVSKWYEGKSCAFCHKPIGGIHHVDHAPALLGRDFQTTEWKRFRPEQLPEVLATHQPVCWNCHVAETFRRLHPGLVVERGQAPKHTT